MKLCTFLGLFLGICPLAFGQANTITPMESNANQFAAQAGAIAGAAQACGQDVSTLSSRTAEVVNVLTQDPAQQQQAMMIYNKILATAQQNQTQNHPMQCSAVLQTYNGLPILRSDYKQTVIPAMTKMGAQ